MPLSGLVSFGRLRIVADAKSPSAWGSRSEFFANSATKNRGAQCSGRSAILSLHPTPYTLHPTPYTLHPTPYTLHPTPYTLHPTPYTLHPTPYTLHPTPYTLHPTPYTLHPTPYTLHPTPYTLLPTPFFKSPAIVPSSITDCTLFNRSLYPLQSTIFGLLCRIGGEQFPHRIGDPL